MIYHGYCDSTSKYAATSTTKSSINMNKKAMKAIAILSHHGEYGEVTGGADNSFEETGP